MRAAPDFAPGSISRKKARSNTTANTACRRWHTCGSEVARAHSSHRAIAPLWIHTRHTPRAASSLRANPSPGSAAPQTQLVPKPPAYILKSIGCGSAAATALINKSVEPQLEHQQRPELMGIVALAACVQFN